MKAIFFFLCFFWAGTCLGQKLCKCFDGPPEDEINRILGSSGCESINETTLIYDACCKKFFYRRRRGIVTELENLNDFKLEYKKPFRFKIIHLNRYLYNVNLSNSDVAFTSAESAVMQQYLIPGSTNGQITPANTFVEGGSGNSGDNIFNIIQSFKPNLDKLLSIVDDALRSAQPVQGVDSALKIIDRATSDGQSIQFYTNRELNKPIRNPKVDTSSIIKTNILIDSLSKNKNSLKILRDTIKNKSERNLDYPEQVNQVTDIYKNDILSGVSDYITNASQVINQIDKNKSDAAYSKLFGTNIFDSYKKNIKELKDFYAEQKKKYSDDSIRRHQDSVMIKTTATILKKAFDTLENYYNKFIDNKIDAYSICTKSFQSCCEKDNKENTYRYFDSLLTKISNAYGDFKASILTAKRNNEALKAAVASQKKPTPATENTAIIKANTSDLIFENGTLTGVKLHNAKEAEKPAKEKPDPGEAAILAIDSTWFLFEKSISPDFIMRQILFNRNLVAENMVYTSPPIFPYGDRMGLVFQIVASDSAKKNGVILDHVTTEALDFLVRGKPLFSFSGGTFAGFGNRLKTPTYEFRQIPVAGSNIVDANSPYKLVKTGNGSTPIGFSGLANVTWRMTWSANFDFRLGISGGVAAILEPAPIRVAYLFGPTISIGTYQQFHFTIGITATNVNKLKDNFNVASDYNYSTSPGSVQYNQVMKAGFFLSIHYTIFNLKNSGKIQTAAVNAGGAK